MTRVKFKRGGARSAALLLAFLLMFTVLFAAPCDAARKQPRKQPREQPRSSSATGSSADDDVNAQVQKVHQLYLASRFAEAHALAQPLADAHPEHGDAVNLAGYVADKVGDAALSVRRHRAAIAVLDSVRAKAGAHGSIGSTLLAHGSFHEAIGEYSKAIELVGRAEPLYYYNRGLTRFHLRDLAGAAADYGAALEIDPDHEAAANNLGVSLMTMERFAEAIDAYKKATVIHERLALRRGVPAAEAALPDARTYFNTLLCLHRVAGDWEHYVANQRLLLRLPGPTQVTPFNCLEFAVISAHGCHKLTREYVRRQLDESRALRPAGSASAFNLSATRPRPPRRGSRDPQRPRKKRRLRVAYVHSNAFRQATTTARLLAAIFEHHDRRVIHAHCASMGGSDGTATRARIERGCETFVDLPEDHAPAARAVHGLGPHIAIDLAGLTIMPITKLLYMRPAPIQVAFHGFPGSSGMPDVDYLITDATASPPQYARALYSERLVLMPHTYFATSYATTHREVLDPARAPKSRTEVGIPARFADASDRFLFCSFNQFYKVTPDLFAAWVRILERLPRAVLWMVTFSDDALANFRRYAPPSVADRIVITGKIPREREYPAKSLCGLFLDAPLFNGHSTASDALWSGVPLVTVMGGAGLPSRVAASLLRSVGLGDLVAANLAAYEELAVAIGGDPALAQRYRARLAHNRLRFPLFDSARFAQNLDAAFQMMWEVHAAGRRPMHLAVSDDAPMERSVPF
jgi:protein O-GlcNAc transferase